MPSWYAHAVRYRGTISAIPIVGLAPVRVGWAIRDSYELLPPAKEFMRMLKEDLQARPAQPGVRVLGESAAA